MDTDWCLTCNKASASTYCSQECRPIAGPSRIPFYEPSIPSLNDDDDDHVVYHEVEDTSPVLHYTGNDYDGITAWAASIPPGPPPVSSSHHQSLPTSRPHSRASTSSAASSRRSSISAHSPKTLTSSRPPELLKPHRPLPPTLCITTTPKPTPSRPSRPIGASSSPSHMHRDTPTGSMVAYSNSTSTGQTSSLATPASAHNSTSLPFQPPAADRKTVFEALTHQVLSWVAPSPFLHSASQSPQQTHSPKHKAHEHEWQAPRGRARALAA